MKPSLILPPSVWYSNVVPYANTYEKINNLHILLCEYRDFLNEIIALFYYEKGNIQNTHHARILMQERLEVDRYLSELETKQNELRLS